MFSWSNFFTSCELPDFLLTKNMTPVGTVKQNKAESAALFLNGEQSFFFYLCCTSYLTPYVPARNRTVIIFSWQHHDMCMGEAQDHRLEIIMHCNDNWKWGWRPKEACDRLYCMRSTGHGNLKLWSQTHPAYSYQQALPFIISLLLLHARNTTLSLSFWNISKFCLSAVENKASLPSLAKLFTKSYKTHAQIWSWSAQTQCTSSQPISLCVQSHTTHYFVNVYYLAISLQLSTGHNQSTVQ